MTSVRFLHIFPHQRRMLYELRVFAYFSLMKYDMSALAMIPYGYKPRSLSPSLPYFLMSWALILSRGVFGEAKATVRGARWVAPVMVDPGHIRDPPVRVWVGG